MAMTELGMDPVAAVACIGVLGVGAQWIAWRMQIPAIVLMLLAGIVVGPVLGVLNPAQDLGPIMAPMISIAVAVILFEGGLCLNMHSLRDATQGVVRLVVVGAPLGWILSTLALHYGAGLGWESSAVFGGIMIVTGPTVIAPLLRQAKLSRRPAALLQWEAIVNDPIGALAAFLAFEYVLVSRLVGTVEHAMLVLVSGIVFATLLGVLSGWGIASAFRRGWVPEYMKVPVLFVTLLAIFAASNLVLHESGLLAVTIMGMWIANAKLPSYSELLRFKEHATVLLVSGVFILLAASLDFTTLATLDWRAVVFLAAVILLVRPLTVHGALLGTDIAWRERWLLALSGPRGVVLVAVAGLFGVRLADVGVQDAELIAPLAFVLVAVTVVVYGFSLKPLAHWLGLSSKQTAGVLIVGGTSWGTEFAKSLQRNEIPVLITDRNMRNLRAARDHAVPVFFGDILSESAEHHVDLHPYQTVVTVTDNDAYNTLVTTDLAPEFGRNNVFQLFREKDGFSRYALPSTLGGRALVQEKTYGDLLDLLRKGWEFRTTRFTDEYRYEDWQPTRPDAIHIALISETGRLSFVSDTKNLTIAAGVRLIHFSPPRSQTAEQNE